jgi:hypothetical protein
MGSRSRFGGFRKGKKLFEDRWDALKEDSGPGKEAPASFPERIQDFEYIYGKGIWDLTSTNQFPKAQFVAPSYSLGLTEPLLSVTGQNASWSQRTVDISGYAGATVRLAFNYLNGSSFTGDIQLDDISLDGTTYGFESGVDGFQTTSANTSAYTSASWLNVATATTGGRWNRRTGNTPSGSTGNLGANTGSFYVYAETSSPGDVSGFSFWLRSPQVTLGASPTLSFYEGRQGAGIGTLDLYLDVIA